jgi:hypothetical protein
VVLYGCENLALTLRKEHRLRVFEDRVLRRIFGPKRDEVTGDWRKLPNEELHNLDSSPSIIRMIKSRRVKWAGHVARMYCDYIPEDKTLHGHCCENIILYSKEIFFVGYNFFLNS